MALRGLSLDRLLMRIGTTALLVLFVPAGAYLMQDVSSSANENLLERGSGLAKTLAGQIVEPMLLEDRLAVHDALRRAVSTDEDVRYLCVVSEKGQVVAHTFGRGLPEALGRLVAEARGEVVYFRTRGGPLMNVRAPIAGGQLGYLHAGISRAKAARKADNLLWMMGGLFAAAVSVVLVGASIVTSKASKPLQRLGAAVSQFPPRRLAPVDLGVSGILEVESLVRGFSDMVRRLESLECDRAATQERMIHAERLAVLGEMAAGLAHEIHNPLDGMLECVRYLDADPDKSERAEKYYPMLRQGLERIARTMREMLRFAHSGQKVFPQPCVVAEVMEGLELLVAPQMKDRKVRLTWDGGHACVCMCDLHGLTQAGLNLVLNAAEAAEGSADPEVHVEAVCDSRWVYIIVEDSGKGIVPELRERVFEAFFTTKPVGRGTGLGLAVSRQLIRAAEGELELASEPSRLGGAKFVIKLPKVAPVEEENGERTR
jgi:signal transduction histidine kinase